MANKSRPPDNTVETWTSKLAFAADEYRRRRDEARAADERMRSVIRGAFDAGLTVNIVAEGTGLSPSRVGQINRGVRN